VLHGVQLWVALPDGARDAPRDFAHHVPPPTDLGGATARVFLGELGGERSPVLTPTPLLGAELFLEPGARTTLTVDPTFEHALLVDRGRVALQGRPLEPGELGVVDPGRRTLEITDTGDEPARLVLLGGPPFGEQIVMWWNFVGRSHDEIVAFREAWEAGSERFGEVEGYVGRDGRRGAAARLPAPALPHATIHPRGNPR
jgi:redox-sensitive bicupin YhaK (pirin superfamily)